MGEATRGATTIDGTHEAEIRVNAARAWLEHGMTGRSPLPQAVNAAHDLLHHAIAFLEDDTRTDGTTP